MNTDTYTNITNEIITLLESGVVPWKSPYFSKIGFPKNFSSGKAYQGINVFLLGGLRYTSPWFLTYIQAQQLGGNVRKGEKGHLVIKYGTYSKESEQAETDETRRFLKGYTVFHATQIEGVSFPTVEIPAELPATARCDRAREIVAGMPNPPKFKEGTAVPCYRRDTDSVHMPERGFFDRDEGYYSVLFHELAHATGHESRLARKSLMENKGLDSGGEDRKTYAEEELVAEMTASFLNSHAEIVESEIENSAAYLQGWIDALKSRDAKSWIIRAASQAQKAANYILNIQPEA